jgi:hypothetical protein
VLSDAHGLKPGCHLTTDRRGDRFATAMKAARLTRPESTPAAPERLRSLGGQHGREQHSNRPMVTKPIHFPRSSPGGALPRLAISPVVWALRNYFGM